MVLIVLWLGVISVKKLGVIIYRKSKTIIEGTSYTVYFFPSSGNVMLFTTPLYSSGYSE